MRLSWLYAIVYKSTFQHCVKEIRKNVLKQTENERSTGSTQYKMHVSKSNIPTTTHLALKQVGIFHFV